MKKLALLLVLPLAACTSNGGPNAADVARWEKEAADVTIVRDDWGIAHVHGKTDADAVFGIEYAQAEDDFNRVETNYINAMGRLAEAEGEGQIWRDLRMKLFIRPEDLRAEYAKSPPWLQKLMDAFADGLNYYLYKHPEVKPKVITHFEPWMALAFTEGSIGGDIERVNLRDLQSFYGGDPTAHIPPLKKRGPGVMVPHDQLVQAETPDAPVPSGILPSGSPIASSLGEANPVDEPTGSNGFAIAPENTVDHHALLLINPHTSFYFRSEAQMSSDEGLDAYGAITWGQFFIYQGFNLHTGWMHTSSGVDNIDEFIEDVVQDNDTLYYRHGDELKPVTIRHITVPYKTDNGMAQREFTAYFTQHGPVVREADGKWISVELMQNPIQALIQSYTRTKTTDYASFKKTMELHTNSSNNTIFADGNGDIAYWHSDFIPRRDDSFDWTHPVDGSDPRTDWGAPLSLDSTPSVLNPKDGWVQNTNAWPWEVSGPDSPKRKDFPKYVERGGENPRGIHAVMVLENKHDFTLQKLIDAAFDSYLTAFKPLVPRLLKAYDGTPRSNPLKAQLAEQIDSLRHWDLRWGVASVPTSLAVFWGTDLMQSVGQEARSSGMGIYDYMDTKTTPQELLKSLAAASKKLTEDFGTWKTPWGDINRFQRLDDSIRSHFDDSKPSIPVGFTSSRWGSLASFGARQYRNTKKWYGTSGNSFVAVVEFGDSVRARGITAGGESGDPKSPHFDDEAERYATGNLREIYFYPSQLVGHTERTYHPGG